MNISELAVKESMRDALTVSGGEAIRTVFEMMSGAKSRPVVVLDDAGVPIGIVTEGDLLRRILAIEIPRGTHLRQILGSLDAALAHISERRRAHGNHVTDVMSAPLISVASDDSLMIAAQLFEEHGIHQIPVIDGGRLVGILHLHDLATFALDQQDAWAHTLLNEHDAGSADGADTPAGE